MIKYLKKMFICGIADFQCFAVFGQKNDKKGVKIFAIKFGSGEKVCTFALPFG